MYFSVCDNMADIVYKLQLILKDTRDTDAGPPLPLCFGKLRGEREGGGERRRKEDREASVRARTSALNKDMC